MTPHLNAEFKRDLQTYKDQVKRSTEEMLAMEDKVQVFKDAVIKSLKPLLENNPALACWGLDYNHPCSRSDLTTLGHVTRQIKSLSMELGLPLVPAMQLMDNIFKECCQAVKDNYSDSFIVET